MTARSRGDAISGDFHFRRAKGDNAIAVFNISSSISKMIRPGTCALLIGTFGCGSLIGWSGAVLRSGSSSPTQQAAAASAETREVTQSPRSAQITAKSKRNAEANSGEETSAPNQRASVLGSALRDALNITDRVDRAMRLREIIGTISPDRFPDVYAEAKKMASDDQWEIMGVLGRRWVEINPREAALFASHAHDFSNLLRGVLQGWCTASPRDALAWIQSQPLGTTRSWMLTSVAETLAQTDPQNALALLKSKFSPSEWRPWNFFYNWAERDPRSAASAVANLTGSSQQDALQAVANSWASSDPRSAMNWANSISNISERKELVASIGASWANVNPQEAISWARGVADEAVARNVFSAAVAHLAETDIGSAVEQIQMLPQGDDRTHVVIAAAESVSQKDVRGALQLLDMAPPTLQRTREALDICGQWANSDPHAALEWITTNLAASKQNNRVWQIVGSWMDSAPTAALDWAQALPENGWRDSIMGFAVGKLAASDLPRAQAMFTSLPSDAQANAAWTISRTLQQRDTQQAIDWAGTLPPGQAQNLAYQAIIQQWAPQNPVAAAQWLGNLPRGQTRDQAVSNFASAVIYRDPESAMAWVLSIDDSRDRDQSIESLYRAWRYANAIAAQSWLQNNNQVTDQLRQRILNH